MKRLITFGLILVLSVVFTHEKLQAATDQRVALVIGNGSYPYAPLHNPLNDANDMANLLGHLGFEVTKKLNVSKIPEFLKRSREWCTIPSVNSRRG